MRKSLEVRRNEATEILKTPTFANHEQIEALKFLRCLHEAKWHIGKAEEILTDPEILLELLDEMGIIAERTPKP